MKEKWRELVAVGLDFTMMLEWTFERGQCLRDRIGWEALKALKAKNPRVDYDNLDVKLHSITIEYDDIEVVFDVGEI